MQNNITLNDIIIWKENPLINPVTKRKIKENGPVYIKYLKLYKKYNLDSSTRIKDRYYDMRKNIIDPILLVKLPLYNKKIKDLYIFKHKWNPYNGKRLTIDSNGPLYFDPNTLIHYFYINRLQNLWVDESDINGEYFEGHYGDAVGNGPDFEIKGRGKHIDWYLFRLPIIDCYIGDIQTQAVTMGPILTNDDIKEIYKLSKRYKNKYTEMYGYKRPNIVKMKKLYDDAIYDNKEYELDCLSIDEIKLLKYQINIDSIEKLKVFK
jgi:hypothetical protein